MQGSGSQSQGLAAAHGCTGHDLGPRTARVEGRDTDRLSELRNPKSGNGAGF